MSSGVVEFGRRSVNITAYYVTWAVAACVFIAAGITTLSRDPRMLGYQALAACLALLLGCVSSRDIAYVLRRRASVLDFAQLMLFVALEGFAAGTLAQWVLDEEEARAAEVRAMRGPARW